ncbi:adenylate/guanylate cyclase domain-containing protein [Cyanobium sp. WKJ7-Wakatipu]|uniref:adenylate/guanylate cyclase domain-containing protein n=1 Tax=Cyanobium sp. WKJ7-Wakatipu TaxID=2823726 RepID=UPI0020CE9D30|nr:adenylate/guanylate cyclase domain-containing protein [Cyanobium sp. WKJ7-Wakatipu]MCP9781934.1 adenylate/guanylate cyclase domain-containing protein [Cyanobium sp. WKJ7-Wakatipu]
MGITWDCAQLSTPWHHPEKTLLEIASEADIEMVSTCGDNAICSTCKVEIIEDRDELEPRSPEELRIAERLKWGDNIRLGCATRFKSGGTVVIKRLIKPPSERKAEKRRLKQDGAGAIRSLAVLFNDLKGFTPLSESLPAFDLVNILNRYFTSLKEEIIKNNGTINPWVGDEMSCVFGINEMKHSSYCEDAVQTAISIKKRIEVLSEGLRKEFSVEIEVGIGIHYDPAVVGNIGPIDDLRFGLVGDAINIASRIERKTRELD